MTRASRREGSGHATVRANAIAKLCAALLRRDVSAASEAMGVLDDEHARGMSPCSASRIRDRIDPLLRKQFGSVRSARALAKGEAGDVEVILADGMIERIEIKAQLEKLRVSQLTEADWVRNETDTLRYLVLHDPKVGAALSPRNRSALAADPSDYLGWSLRELWLADVAGLDSIPSKLRYGVRSGGQLAEFMSRKHLLHMCDQRDSIRRLAEIGPIRSALAGKAVVQHELKMNKGSECALQIYVAAAGPVFTYHIYKYDYVLGQGFCGRHKLHGTML